MVIYEVVSCRAANPAQPGNMLERGHRIYLEPDLYDTHKALEKRILRSLSFKEVDPKPPTPPEPAAKPGDGLLPHQRQALARLRSHEPGPS